VSARTQSKQLWLGGGAVVALLIVVIGWFGVIDPEMSAATSLRDDADLAEMQNMALEGKNAKLKAQNDDVAALRASLADALASLPSDGGLPEFTRQVSAQATATSVVLASIVVGGAAPVAEPAAAGTDSNDSGTANSETTTSTEPEASAGLLQIAITMTATGIGADLQAFVSEIQVTGPRRALVTASQIAPAGDNPGGIDGNSTLTLSLNIFSAPVSPDAQAALEKLLSGN